jgi:hypothetical protein
MIAFAAVLAFSLTAEAAPAVSTPPAAAAAEATAAASAPAAAPAPSAVADDAAGVPPAPASRPLFAGSDGGWMPFARAGTFVPTYGKFKHFRAATALEAGLRRRVLSFLDAELSGGLVTTDTDDLIASRGERGEETWTHAELTMAPALASVRATYRAGPLEAFAAAGGGLHYVQLYKRAAAPGLEYGDTDRDFKLGAFVATGAGVRLTPSLSAGYEVRYTYLEPRLFGVTERADGLGLSVGASYRF